MSQNSILRKYLARQTRIYYAETSRWYNQEINWFHMAQLMDSSFDPLKRRLFTSFTQKRKFHSSVNRSNRCTDQTNRNTQRVQDRPATLSRFQARNLTVQGIVAPLPGYPKSHGEGEGIRRRKSLSILLVGDWLLFWVGMVGELGTTELACGCTCL